MASGIDDAADTAGPSREPPAEHPVQATAALFGALTQHSNDIITLLDAEGRLIYNSPATARISGFTPEELARIDTFEMMHPEDRDRVRRVFERVLAEPGSVHTVRYRYRTKAGGWLWMEAVASNQLDNPDARGVVANCRDISEQVRADEERVRMHAQMLKVQRLKSLGLLAGGLAHDFNNLLTVVLGEADLLHGDGSSSTEVRRAAASIRDAAQRASELTHQLLAYAGNGPLAKEAMDLSTLLAGMEPLLALTVGSENHLRIDGGEAGWIEADGPQLRQAVLNLVQNAAESAAGGVDVEVRVRRVDVDEALADSCVEGHVLAPGPHVALTVADSGAGLSADEWDHVFDPFVSTKGPGRGLGLAAVYGIVQRHEAALRIEAREPRGTAFTIYFPEVAAPPKPATTPEPDPRGQGRALVVDDDPRVGPMTKLLMETAGFSVSLASSGAEALELHEPGAFDLVVLDMVMPGMDGAETLGRLREREPGLPVLLYSGFDDGIAGACLREPATAFLNKPFTLRELIESVRALLEPKG